MVVVVVAGGREPVAQGDTSKYPGMLMCGTKASTMSRLAPWRARKRAAASQTFSGWVLDQATVHGTR